MKKYNLTDEQYKKIASLAVQENDEAGVSNEVSLMANLFEMQTKYKNIYDYIRYSGWFSRAEYWMDKNLASQAAIKKTIDVLKNANRTLPTNVDEHDCYGDIVYIKVNGKTYTNKNDKEQIRKRSNYIKDKTIIYNAYNSTYTFYCFAHDGKYADPMGYTDEAYKKKKDEGSNSSSTSTSKSSTVKATEKTIKICGHGSGNPSTKVMHDYFEKRYNQYMSNGKRKGIVAVKRLKPLTDTERKKFHDTYKTILGRNIYSQDLRDYCYTPYNGKYYSDCSSSGMRTFAKINSSYSFLKDYNTQEIYESSRFETVNVKISNGHITNPEILKVGDCLLFAGNPSRPKYIGHVEYVYEISGTTPSSSSTSSSSSKVSTPTKLTESVAWNGIVTASSLNVRSWAGTENSTVSFSPLLSGTKVGVCAEIKADDGSSWYYIKYNGKYGFVSAEYVKKS